MSLVVGTNSWVTVAEADTYFTLHIDGAKWTALTTDDKNKYLVTAYRWIFNNPGINVSATNSTQKVKDGQCQASLFLINYYDEYTKRDALIASGVKDFTYGKRREALSEIKMPSFLLAYFDDYITAGGVSVFTLTPEDY